MTKSTRRLMVLVGSIAMLALALSAAFPVWAQTGTGGGSGGNSGQAGTTFTVQSGDTLGGLVSRYSLSGANLRQFFSTNQNLILEAGQTVSFPAGVVLNMNQGATGTTGQGTTGGASDTTATATLDASGAAVATATPDASGAAVATATLDASGAAVATATPDASGAGVATATPATGGTMGGTNNPYTTLQGDTLATVLNAMGFQATASASGNVTDAQLREFVTANTGLRFTSGQTVSLPAGIPQTGGANATTLQNINQNYSVQAGDTLETLAARYGLTVQQLLAANPTLLQSGMTLNVPVRQGTFVGNETMATLISRYGLTGSKLVNFMTINRDLALNPDQTICVPVTGTTSGNTTGSTSGTTAQATATTVVGSGAGVATATPDASGAAVATATPDASGAAVATATPDASGAGVATATPDASGAAVATATPAAGGAAVATATPATSGAGVATATLAVSGTTGGTTSQVKCASGFTAYTTQQGDTLNTLVGQMGLDLNSVPNTGTSNTSGNTAGDTTTTVQATATPAAGSGADVATATPDASGAGVATATPAAGGNTSGGTTGTGTTGGNTTGGMTSGASNQANVQANNLRVLQQFVNNASNRNLTFQAGQTFIVPGAAVASSGTGIPATGGSGAGVSGATGGTGTGNQGLNMGLTDAPKGTGIYIVQSGDTVEGIARKFGITAAQIYSFNGGLTSDFLLRGQRLIIPGVEGKGLWQNQMLNQSPSTSSNGIPATGGSSAGVSGATGGTGNQGLNMGLTDAPKGTGIYIVQSGDSVEGIARRFGITADQIYSFNGNLTSNFLLRGQRLVIPGVEGKDLWQNQMLNQTPSTSTSK